MLYYLNIKIQISYMTPYIFITISICLTFFLLQLTRILNTHKKLEDDIKILMSKEQLSRY
jgi:hypothetical protein